MGGLTDPGYWIVGIDFGSAYSPRAVLSQLSLSERSSSWQKGPCSPLPVTNCLTGWVSLDTGAMLAPPCWLQTNRGNPHSTQGVLDGSLGTGREGAWLCLQPGGCMWPGCAACGEALGL